MSDIFISYASKNKNVADTLCAKLEQKQQKCWIAPRDIKPGEEYAAGIVRGIDNCKCMVIIFSEASNASKHVLREVERAVGCGAVVIPFRIDDIMPTDSMDYFLKVAHWLDAKDMKLEEAIDKLSHTVAGILGQGVQNKETSSVSENVNSGESNPMKFVVPALLVSALIGGAYWFASNSEGDDIKGVDSEVVEKKRQPQNEVVPTIEQQKKALLSKLIGQNKALLSDASIDNVSSTLDISTQIPNKDLKLKAWIEPERSQFMEDDKIQFKASLGQDAYLAVYVHSMDGSTYLIYPNHLEAPSKIKKDQVFTVGSGSAFELEVAEPFGVDVVQFIATNDEAEFEHLLAKHSPIQGMNIATAIRADVVKEMKGIKKRGLKVKGIKVVTASDKPTDDSMKIWGESILLLNTKAKE